VRYSRAVSAIASYPGTVTPLRGLSPFAESERDVFFGRDRECEELARLVIGEGFRAGLLYGPAGVGKTSLLRAGVIPHLRDHGVMVIVCDDLRSPIASFAQAVSAATGFAPAENERPITFLARVVGQSLAGQLYLFVVDEVEELFQTGDERVVGELGDLFARVVSRSGGRARFLFSCASDRVHLFGALERRTGSLFPPSARYELQPLAPAVAGDVLARTLAFAGIQTDATVGRAITDAIGQIGPVRPADLQIAMLAIRELELGSAEKLEAIGGPGELTSAWLHAACRATGNERSALRLIAELAAEGADAYVPDWAAARASLDPSFAAHALEVLALKGVVRRVVIEGSESPHYALAHTILAPRVREVAAPARAAARRAFELLGSKAAQRKRLGAREWLELRREGIQPATPAERAVIDRTKRTALIAAGAVAAAPLIALIAIYIALAGSYHLDVAERPGGAERVVVRAGNPSLHRFYWMPHSPRFGSIVADTGLTRAMTTDDAWDEISSGRRGRGIRRGDVADESMAALRPSLRALIEYAADGSESALGQLRRGAEGPEDLVELLEALRPIARGGPQEIAVVEQALRDASPAVQSAALAVAASAAKRGASAYRRILAGALGAADHERRRLAFSAVRSLGDEQALEIVQEALAAGPGAAARRELLAVVTRDDPAQGPSAVSATSVLANEEIDDATRQRARNLLRRAFLLSAEDASAAAAALAANDDAPQRERVFALELLHKHVPEEAHGAITDDIRAAMRASAEPIRAAALPVLARVAPAEAAGDLALMMENTSLSTSMREAMALAWGEAISVDRAAAHAALDALLEDSNQQVRAAAARAYGKLGRTSQRPLVALINNAPFNVKVGAAYGLAASAVSGGNGATARAGIYTLWRARGASQRAAAEVYAHMAHDVPNLVIQYAYSAARDSRDASLHPIGIEGLCNGVAAGNATARNHLIRVASDASPELRGQILECALDHAEHASMSTRIARELADDRDPAIRAAAARVLASVAELHDEAPSGTQQALLRLARDSSREVRMIAFEGITSLGDDAPDVAETLAAVFEGADQAEKLAILRAAGATDAGELAALGLADDAPLVRIAAMGTAIDTDTDAGAALSSALTDPEARVRRAALARIARGEHPLPAAQVSRALGLAVRDPDPEIGMLALETLARIGDVDQVRARLARMLDSRSERERVRAAKALAGLAPRDPAAVRALLEPHLDDRSHDVRVALLDSLATAYAATLGGPALAEMIRDAETHATRRVVAIAALAILARTDPEAASVALDSLEDAPALAREAARISRGLIAAEADGVTFLALLVP
jgi:hypothetical protein